MSKILLLSLLLVLSACNIGVKQNITVPGENKASMSEVPENMPTPVVSSEVPPEEKWNTRLESEEFALIEELRIQGEKEMKKSENTTAISAWAWSAHYTPPKYPDGLDSITVSLSGETYTLPGIYGKSEREAYLENIEAAKSNPESSCNDQEKLIDSVEIDGKYYRPPMSADCMFGLNFGYFDSFSPSGFYLIYHVSGYERGDTRVVDIKTGEEVEFESGKNGPKKHISWTPDRKQMIFVVHEGMWGEGESPGLYITKEWAFPKADKISEIKEFISVLSDDTTISLLESGVGESLRILDRKSGKEVYEASIPN